MKDFLKNKKVMLAAGAAVIAALALIRFFTYSGWAKLPGREQEVFLEHGKVMRDAWIREWTRYYHTDEDGARLTGLQELDGAKYYFDEETGVMQTGWLDIVTDDDPAQAPAGGTYGAAAAASDDAGTGISSEAGAAAAQASLQRMYFLEDSGQAAAGWQVIGDREYLFSPEGILQTGWVTVGGRRYLLDEEGAKCTGWQDRDGERYYLGGDGAMRTGWVTEDGKQYLLDDEGHLRTGHLKVDGKRYFFGKDGALQTGWVREGDKLFYYGEDGTLKTGLVTVGEETYYLSRDGKIQSGWHEPEGEEGSSFYVCSDGFVLDPWGGTGNYGRLIVHSAGLDVNLNTAVSRDQYQQVVDAENSALVVQERHDIEPVIADRRSQGFDLSKVEADTTAVVVYPDHSVREYTCVRTGKGINLGNDVIDLEGNSVWEQNEDGLGAYASAGSENREEVIVVFWEPIGES